LLEAQIGKRGGKGWSALNVLRVVAGPEPLHADDVD